MLAGECLLIVEGEERKLKQWDLFHSPPKTEHIIVGAGDGPAVVLAVGARGRRRRGMVYPGLEDRPEAWRRRQEGDDEPERGVRSIQGLEAFAIPRRLASRALGSNWVRGCARPSLTTYLVTQCYLEGLLRFWRILGFSSRHRRSECLDPRPGSALNSLPRRRTSTTAGNRSPRHTDRLPLSPRLLDYRARATRASGASRTSSELASAIQRSAKSCWTSTPDDGHQRRSSASWPGPPHAFPSNTVLQGFYRAATCSTP